MRSYVYIFGDPGATSWEEAIFSGESFLQELKSLWELILTEAFPELVEFCPSDWLEKYFSAQSARMSTQVTDCHLVAQSGFIHRSTCLARTVGKSSWKV